MIDQAEALRRWNFDLCARCAEPLPEHDNWTMTFCSNRCRQAAYRARVNYRKADPDADPHEVERAAALRLVFR
ncbi:hypothetical protein [Krasilnikoviella flava]|uniref:Uncharacterized protein n=1 Tax=Krasilnikoviella flava TaxID=526729 RepID=A0A1T5JQ47_9MICO|nr:hypothetical protein [Krasilnikoviella flava]SKC53516.1 hypothetical protein SAMN04324258_1617 [Krasilnikoviella flava]